MTSLDDDALQPRESTIADAIVLANGDIKKVADALDVEYDDVEQQWLRLYGDAPPILRSSKDSVCQWHRMMMLRSQAMSDNDTALALKAEVALRKLLAGHI